MKRERKEKIKKERDTGRKKEDKYIYMNIQIDRRIEEYIVSKLGTEINR